MIRAYLVVKHGPYSGKSTPIGPGDLVRFGRSGEADVYLPNDNFLDAVHFAICSDDAQVHIFSLTNAGVLVVNGLQVEAAKLKDGDSVFAGITEWCVHIHRDDYVSPSAPAQNAIDQVVQQFVAWPGHHYALVDAARGEDVLSFLEARDWRFDCLYQGPAAVRLEDVAPYLLSIRCERGDAEVVAREFWGRSSICLFTSSSPVEEVRSHFRRFTYVLGPDGGQMYFRFYDPRILRAFIRECTEEEQRQFFGPVDTFLLQGDVTWEAETLALDARRQLRLDTAILRTEDIRVVRALVQRVSEETGHVPST